MEEEKSKRNAEELQQCIDQVRKEAEEQGLSIVVIWVDEYGGKQSVTLNKGDKITIGVRR